MQRLAVEFLDQAFHRVLFNAMPMPVFVVDGEVSILDYNTAAAQLVGTDRRAVVGKRGGDVLHCINALKTPGGCGNSPACPDCVLREAVRVASKGRAVTRKWTSMELQMKGKLRKKDLRVTCQPVAYEHQSLVLLILEGLND